MALLFFFAFKSRIHRKLVVVQFYILNNFNKMPFSLLVKKKPLSCDYTFIFYLVYRKNHLFLYGTFQMENGVILVLNRVKYWLKQNCRVTVFIL